MDLTQLSKQLNLPLAKLRALVKKQFGNVTKLTDEQVKQLQENLQDAASIAVLPPSDREQEINDLKSLDVSSANNIDVTIKAIGITHLKRNIDLFERTLINQIIETKRKVDTATDVIESYAQQKVSQTYQNMARNLQAVNEEMTAESFTEKMDKSVKSNEKLIITDEDLELLELELEIS